MEEKNRNKFEIGDWVRLQSNKGEHIHGYVEKRPENKDVVQLRVIASDNEWLSGHSIQVKTNKIEKDHDFLEHSIGELEQLIDLALLTKDEAWFDSLVLKYKALKDEEKAQQSHYSSTTK